MRALQASGFAFAVLGAVCFSFKAILVKLAYRYGVDAETLLALRMGYALPFFVAMGISVSRREPRQLSRRDLGMLLLLGITGYYLASYLDFLGLRYITAALERLILFIYPTLVVLLSAVFLKKPLSRALYLPMALCYFGIALAVGHDLDLAHAGSNVLLGCILVFGSTLSYAIYLMLSGEEVRPSEPHASRLSPPVSPASSALPSSRCCGRWTTSFSPGRYTHWASQWR